MTHCGIQCLPADTSSINYVPHPQLLGVIYFLMDSTDKISQARQKIIDGIFPWRWKTWVFIVLSAALIFIIFYVIILNIDCAPFFFKKRQTWNKSVWGKSFKFNFIKKNVTDAYALLSRILFGKFNKSWMFDIQFCKTEYLNLHLLPSHYHNLISSMQEKTIIGLEADSI